MVTYSESGVDIDLEALTVSKIAEKLKPTLDFRNIISINCSIFHHNSKIIFIN